VAAGIRRIEMITGAEAEHHFKAETQILSSIRTLFKNPKDIVKSIDDLIESQHSLVKEVENLIKGRNKALKNELLNQIEEINGMKVLSVEIELDSPSVKDILFQLKGQLTHFVGLVGHVEGDKCGISVILSDELVNSKGWNATQWIRDVASLIQGGGGGQPFFATAGGKNPKGIDEALKVLKSKLLPS
jgi:alanyl-tRNA synthetase